MHSSLQAKLSTLMMRCLYELVKKHLLKVENTRFFLRLLDPIGTYRPDTTWQVPPNKTKRNLGSGALVGSPGALPPDAER